MNRVLITGYYGFIGQHLVKALKLINGVEIIGFDLEDGHDLRKPEHQLPDADWCFHLAALTNARSANLKAMMDTNVMGTLRVLEQFDDRVVFASSSAVNYPDTPYAVSKITCESMCGIYGARIVRLCNIYGKGGHGVFQRFEKADTLEIAGAGDQVRTYAPVEDAVAALIEAPASPQGSLTILHGEDLTVLQVADRFPDKPRKQMTRAMNDIQDGRQICP